MGIVRETRIIFETRDILAVRIRCTECGADNLYEFRSEHRITGCGICGTDWAYRGDDFYPLMRDILQSLRRLKQWTADAPVTLLYEIDGKEGETLDSQP